MTYEELIIPRYQQLVTYPGQAEDKGTEMLAFTPDLIYFFDSYPEVFRKLRWDENRINEDMPQYLKNENGGIVRVLKWSITTVDSGFFIPDMTYPEKGRNPKYSHHSCHYHPASEAEYKKYIEELEAERSVATMPDSEPNSTTKKSY